MTQHFENLEFDDGPRQRAVQESLAPRGSTGTPEMFPHETYEPPAPVQLDLYGGQRIRNIEL